MTRYLEVSRDIAERIRSGQLLAGSELPPVRELAQRFATTTSTAGRALRHLADQGVLSVGGQRPARVRPDGPLAARRMLDGYRTFRLVGSDDPALDVLCATAGAGVVTVGERGGSFPGLIAVARRTADGAAIHLLHRDGTYNATFVRALLRERRPRLVHLWRREQGILLPPGNPQRVRAAADLAGRRVAKRPAGTGTRVLLDRRLLDAGVAPESVAGPEFGSHLEVALAVASGLVDAGLAIRAAASALDLAFMPLAWESYDIATTADALPAAAPLLAALRAAAVRDRIGRLGGYDLEGSAEVTEL